MDVAVAVNVKDSSECERRTDTIISLIEHDLLLEKINYTVHPFNSCQILTINCVVSSTPNVGSSINHDNTSQPISVHYTYGRLKQNVTLRPLRLLVIRG